jgi:hypothetical protein
MKNENLSASILMLKNKNRKMENFKEKTINKKLKNSEEVEELEFLIKSTKMKNKDTFTPEVLSKLDELSK